MIGRRRLFGSSRGNSFRRNAPRRTPRAPMIGLTGLLRVVGVILVALLLWLYLRDLRAPGLTIVPEGGPINPQKEIALQFEDRGAGLRRITVSASQGGKSSILLQKDFPAGTANAREVLSLAKAGLVDGPCELTIEATDRAWFPTFGGNRAQRSLSFVLDRQPPQIEILDQAHNFTQGGAGLVAYRLSEEATSGVRVGDHFFPGFRQPAGYHVALVAAPWNLPPSAFVPKIVATDAAGNERVAGIYFHFNARTFPTDRIPVSDAFLESKIVPDFQHFFPETTRPLELFLRVNRELRTANLKTIRSLGSKTAATPLWQGGFVRQPRAAVPGYFAQTRTYLYRGEAIDRQTHLGIDLASTAQAPVPATNAGTVVFAEELGIYGQCVILDHGLGLQSLYGHLSRIAVKTGQQVAKGEIIGNTGKSGLAVGDHLHFDLLVAGQQVNPLEWWDAQWLENNIMSKLRGETRGASEGR